MYVMCTLFLFSPVIYLASYEAMTECFVNNADDFSDYHCKSHQPGVLANGKPSKELDYCTKEWNWQDSLT